MLYNLDNYKFETNPEEEIKFEDEIEFSKISNNRFISPVWTILKAMIRTKILQMIFFLVFTFLLFLITGDYNKSKTVANEASTEGVKENYTGLFKIFARESKHKNTKLNVHPVYHTKAVKKLEENLKLKLGYDVKFDDLFAYAIFDQQDFLVMKKAARGKNKDKLKYELSTIFGESANDYCEDFFNGFVMDDEQRKIFIKSWRVSKIKDELTQDNDDGEKYFRCVIGPDTIKDFLEAEND